MNIREFEDKLNILLDKYDYKEKVMWGTSAKYNDVAEFYLTKSKHKDKTLLAISKRGEYKIFDAMGIFPSMIKGFVEMFLEQDKEEWFRGMTV